MGNVHEVVQVEPYQSWCGAALPIHPGRHGAVQEVLAERQPPYVGVTAATRQIGLPDGRELTSPTDRVFVAVQTGGKWGWDALAPFLEAVAGQLADARFFLNDEYQGFVDEYRIVGGELTVRRVCWQDSTVAGYLAAEEPRCHDFAYTRLVEDLLEEPWNVDPALAEAMSQVHPQRWETRAAAALVAAAAERWPTAVATLRSVLSDLEPAAPDWLRDEYVTALARTEPAEALRIAREYEPRWRASRSSMMVELAALEEGHGDPDRAVSAMARSMVNRFDPPGWAARSVRAGAELLRLSGHPDEAADWEQIAELL